jgi:HSP20 family molecular chaperone IbpA
MKKAKSAPKLVVLENGDPISAESEAIQSRIRQRAFELSQTRPDHARELYDWIMAESEVRSVPPVRVVERNGTLEARFAIAGVHPEDMNVMVTSNQILIKGEYNERRESNEGTVHLSDYRSATVFRSVTLPHAIDTKTVKVDFEHGVLRVIADIVGAKHAAPASKAPAKKRAKAAKA